MLLRSCSYVGRRVERSATPFSTMLIFHASEYMSSIEMFMLQERTGRKSATRLSSTPPV